MYDHKIIYKSTSEFLQFLNQKEKQAKKSSPYKKENKHKDYNKHGIKNS
jgi:hypothetical protein